MNSKNSGKLTTAYIMITQCQSFTASELIY